MKKFVVSPTNESPEINLDLNTGIFTIKGKSIAENAHAFYQPALDWLDQKKQHISTPISFIFDLQYFDVSSSKMLLEMLGKLEEIKQTGVPVNVIWNFSEKDSDMREVGEDFSCMVDLPFQFENKSALAQFA